MAKEKGYPEYGYYEDYEEKDLEAYSTEYIQAMLENAKQSKQNDEYQITLINKTLKQYRSSIVDYKCQIDSIKNQIFQIADNKGPVILSLLNCYQMFHDAMRFWMEQANNIKFTMSMSMPRFVSQQYEVLSDVEKDVYSDLIANQIISDVAETQERNFEAMVKYWESQISRLEDKCISLVPETDQYLKAFKSTYEKLQAISAPLSGVEQSLLVQKNLMLSDINLIQMCEEELQSRKETNNMK